MKKIFREKTSSPGIYLFSLVVALAVALFALGAANADVPGGRKTPSGSSVPNPGTQEQEVANITFPAPYNVFEFVVTCAACHGGSIDQQAGHFGNWSGSNMASAARDPIFRANQQIVNSAVKAAIGQDGAGNICIRCHSPNAWYSGRTDPLLNGDADASSLIHSIVLSTDDEGILCEFCHRSIGTVTQQRADLSPTDPAWNMMAGIFDWPHLGNPYPQGPLAGNPYGDATLQINDGMTYIGKYSGSVDLLFSDIPLLGTGYTGQTYGIYPPAWMGPKYPVPAGEPQFNASGEEIVYNPDGSVPVHYEIPIGPPLNPDGTYNYQLQAISLEHPTVGDRPLPLLPQPAPHGSRFVRSPEFCGSCHDLSIPVLNHGMPEQRTYTEWKYSSFGSDPLSPAYKRCQDCHMPTMKHEYSDDAAVSLNPDPLLAGWFPYGKDRNPNGGTTFHKFAGSNIDLQQMMRLLYPEVDMEVIGAPTGNDTRIFPGMLSGREIMWERSKRNTEISLNDAIDVQITRGPVEVSAGIWEVDVRVRNKAGHRIPSGYPDGRRFWLNLVVTDGISPVYVSGYYNADSATLYDEFGGTVDDRALTNFIDATVDNKVMIYEKRTGVCDAGMTACTMSVSLLNDKILFDNRIPPEGFNYASYSPGGTKFISYNPLNLVPSETPGRFTDNTDTVTYRFSAPTGSVLDARAEVYWQTHSREFLEHLRINNTSTYRPEGGPDILDPNYPLTPTYLSESLLQTTGQSVWTLTALDGTPLRDNWGGIAYAAWLLTGKGAPYLAATDDTLTGAPPAAPATVTVNTVPGDPFKLDISWSPVPDAEGYIVWVQYGISPATADWDRLAVIQAPTTSLVNDGMNVGKTYNFKVQAFNGKGTSADSPVTTATTPIDLPLAPENLRALNVTNNTVQLSWMDVADNETGFYVERQQLLPNGTLTQWVRIAIISTPNNGGFGGVLFTDGALMDTCSATVTIDCYTAEWAPLQPGTTYNYQVQAFNAAGTSTFNVNGPITVTTLGIPMYSISGTITTSSGTPVANVNVDLTGGVTPANTTTDAGGNYHFTGLAPGNYTVTPTFPSGSFTPANAPVSIVDASATGIDFTLLVYSISGTVRTTGGIPVSGATINLTGAATMSAISDVNGNYTFDGLMNGAYSVTASLANQTFAVSTIPVTISNASAADQDFTVNTYAISGTVTIGGNPMSGVSITLSGTTNATVVTGAPGTYTFTDLLNGTYTITPGMTGFTFTPVNRTVPVAGADVAGQDFAVTDFISITVPNGGENWPAGTTQTITWLFGGNVGTSVRLELLRGGATIASIIRPIGTAGSGSFTWTISPGLPPANDYAIRLTGTTVPAATDTSALFTISAPPGPAISVISPAGGENWRRNTFQTIRWTYTGNPGNYVRVELLNEPSGTVNRTISAFAMIGTGGNGSYSWYIPFNQTPAPGNYRIRVRSTSNPAATGTSSPLSIVP